jgi:hypothetical protein
MIGAKRGINFYENILLEYDMRIKIVGRIIDDLQLIDGVTIFSDTTPISCQVLTNHILGDYGTIDLTRSLYLSVIFSMGYVKFSSFKRSWWVAWFKDYVIMMNTHVHLKFKVGIGHGTAEHSCSFEAKTLRCVSHQIVMDFASISVTVTWSMKHFWISWVFSFGEQV